MKNICKKTNKGVTLIALVVTIVVLLILAGVTISTITGENGIIAKAQEAKIMQTVATLKEKIQLNSIEDTMEGSTITVEQLLKEGKVVRRVKFYESEDVYYMHYAIKPEAYSEMGEFGKGDISTLKDVFLIDDKLNIKYIDNNGKEYGDNIDEKILRDETDIRFADAAFANAVTNYLGVTEDKVKFGLMKNLTRLEISSSSINTLEDLIFFPNLENLIIMQCYSLNSLNGVENCPKLRGISLYACSIQDYTALSNLKTLNSLLVNNSAIANFKEFAESLKNGNSIESIDIHNVTIKKDEQLYLGLLKKLKSLSISNGNISSVEFVTELENLEKLSLNNNDIENILPISSNEKLTELSLLNNPKIDGNKNNYQGEDLEKLNKIGEILDRGGNIYVNVDKLGLFQNYKKLDLSGQNLENLDVLEGMTELTQLNISNNKLTLEDEKSKNILKSMTKLKSLNIGDNNISDISFINNLSLTNLAIQGKNGDIQLKQIEDKISSINDFRITNDILKTIENCNAEKITALNLVANTQVSELPQLSKLFKLEKLALTYNSKIKDYSEISKIKSLKILNLQQSEMHGKIPDLSNLTNLVSLNLNYNKLWDEDLKQLKGLKNNTGLKINLLGNSIINASTLLEFDNDKIVKISLNDNVNLSEETKEKLKNKFGSKVEF